ncbi:hypothetical protein BOX15_Mlig032100g2 [Macrostomum lignano]|uniref:Innexin n=1 Tax=Macrostomum lignano TaxID=282301 RepID=A0A267E2H0_9PLAT|nr:hypothetical protein BOX15_Mlig032100g2 [Macrostomum lignano]
MKVFEFFEYIRTFGLLSSVGLLDFGDRVTFLLSAIVLLVCSLVIGAKEYFTKSISCMLLHKFITPFTMMDAQMIESYCWVTGVYPLRMTEPLPDVSDEWLLKHPTIIRYYLWVPLLLALQALLCYLPKALFDLICFSRSAYCLSFIAVSAREASLLSPARRAERVDELATCLADLLVASREYRQGRAVKWATAVHRCLPWCPISKRFGNYTFVMYLVTKLAGLAVLLLQLELMRQFLGFQSLSYGAELMRNITMGLDWEITMVLPRLGACRFTFPDRTSVISVTPYCTISSNIFTEKVYIILWFYFVLAAIVNSASILLWLRRFLLTRSRCQCLRSLIRGCGCPGTDQDETWLERFEFEFIRIDGLFFLWMIRLNCGHIVTGEIVRNIFCDFVRKMERSGGSGGARGAEASLTDSTVATEQYHL